MPLSRSRDYLSIGEVLESVRGDFPDISISKIRFLEAEGLIAPERTASGYRKFYDGDIKRLRYILSLQRDHFLPLKVIRERLDRADSNGGNLADVSAESEPASGAPSGSTVSGVQMSRSEFVEATGLTDMELRGLEDFGILRRENGQAFDEGDLVVARTAQRLFAFGIEPRHLRMYRQFAERELAFFDQIVSPVARKRDPESAQTAARSLRELAELGQRFHDGLLRSALRDQL
jgi:DNA-binding transcriptional MerR regulator